MKKIIQYKSKLAATQSEKCFVRKQQMYTLAEKKELEKLISKCKDLEGKTNYNYKRKKHVPKKPKLFIAFIAASEELSCRSFKGKT